MELRQLIYFEAVVRCGGFTRAAEQLHIAQSAVSAQVRALEAELGVSLLARTTRRVTLTHAGELFLARARRVLGELDDARGELAELATVLRGRVTIGATSVTGPFDLPDALARFHARYPGVAVTLRSGLMAGLLDELDAGRVDLVLGPMHTDLASRFSGRKLADEELLLILPPGHRLARAHRPAPADPAPAESTRAESTRAESTQAESTQAESTRAASTLADLRDEPFVCLRAESELRAILDSATAAAGFVARVQFEAPSPASIRELVSAGLGVALLARSAVDRPGPPIDVRRLDPAPAHPPIGLIHHRDRRLSAAAQACRQHLIERAVKTVGERAV